MENISYHRFRNLPAYFPFSRGGQHILCCGKHGESGYAVLYSSADAGLNWTSEEIDVAGVLPEGYYMDAADTDGAGNLVLEYSVLDSDRNITESKVVKVTKEGTADELFDCGG